MKRRINNLYKGMFKGNKTSNIIELHSRKKNAEKKENQNLNISFYENKNNNLSKNNKSNNNINPNKDISSNNNNDNKDKQIMNLYDNSFSDSDSSHNKSLANTKLYGKYAKSGKYFKKLRQQVIDKFISGKPLISIDRMYNNPEVKKMFGIKNNSEKTNYQSNSSFKKNDDNFLCDNMSIDEERDRRIPPSKFLPLPNNNNVFNDSIQYNDINNNFNNINNLEEITQNYKINPVYYNNQNLNPNQNIIIFEKNNEFLPPFYNQKHRINNINNMKFINDSEKNEINLMNSNRNMIEFNYLNDLNNEYRKKRISHNKSKDKYMIQFKGINEELNNEEYSNNYYQNENKEKSEAENINNLLNNLKKENNNYNIFTNINKENNSYFNNYLINKDMGSNYINYFKNQQSIIENSEQNNDIRFDTPIKK